MPFWKPDPILAAYNVASNSQPTKRFQTTIIRFRPAPRLQHDKTHVSVRRNLTDFGKKEMQRAQAIVGARWRFDLNGQTNLLR